MYTYIYTCMYISSIFEGISINIISICVRFYYNWMIIIKKKIFISHFYFIFLIYKSRLFQFPLDYFMCMEFMWGSRWENWIYCSICIYILSVTSKINAPFYLTLHWKKQFEEAKWKRWGLHGLFVDDGTNSHNRATNIMSFMSALWNIISYSYFIKPI